MPASPIARLRKLCLALPEAHEVEPGASPRSGCGTRSSPCTQAPSNHHGRGRNATWVKAAPGDQAAMVAAAPDCFFVPPYVGPSGWIGIWLDGVVDWDDVAEFLRDSYRLVAPKKLSLARLGRLVNTAAAPTAAPENSLTPGVTAPWSRRSSRPGTCVRKHNTIRPPSRSPARRCAIAKSSSWFGNQGSLYEDPLAHPERDLVVHVKSVADLAQPDDSRVRKSGPQPSVAPDRHDHEPDSAQPDPDEVPGAMPDAAVSQVRAGSKTQTIAT